MASLVLIHSATYGGWCWEDVVPLLRDRGHVVHAPDLPGMGEDRTAFADDVLAQWVDAVERLVGPQSRSTMLVGHGLGGAVVSALAERIPDRVALAVFLAGMLLADGKSVSDTGAVSDALRSRLVRNAAGTATIVPPDAARELIYRGIEPDVADRAVARMVEQPSQPMSAPLHLTPERFGRVPKAYIEVRDDPVVLLSKQREMQRNWPCDEVRLLASGHSPFYQVPKLLADVLDQLASKYAA